MGSAQKHDLEDFEDFSSITSLIGDDDHSGEETKLQSYLFYKVWENVSPYIRDFDEDYFHKSKYY